MPAPVSVQTQEQTSKAGSPAARSQVARELAAVLKMSADREIDEAYVPVITRDSRFDDKYGELGERLYTSYVQRARATGDEALAKRAERGVSLHGCYVLTKILSFAPPAYVDYLKENPGVEPSVSGLTAIMARSGGAAKTFADMDKKSNTTVETAMGLLGFPPQYDDMPPFVIAANPQSELEFTASPVVLAQVKREATFIRLGEGMSATGSPDERCPAIGMVLDTLWQWGVEACGTESELYEADIAALTA